MAFGGLLDGFLNENAHGGGGGVQRKASAFAAPPPPRKTTTFSMYQNQEYNNMGGSRKYSSMSMMQQQKKMSTVSTVSVDVYPKYSSGAVSNQRDAVSDEFMTKMWGDSEKPDPLLLGNHHHHHHHRHPHHTHHPHPHHFGLAAKPFYHHHPHHLGAGTAAFSAAQLPATSSSTPTASAHPHHSHQASTSSTVGGSLNALRTRSTTQPAIVMWKGETSRKKRFEPFCSPMVPHVPIRERLARRGTSADMMSDDASAYTLYAPRRRRMSLLQSLRQQNRALADSGLDMPNQRPRTDSESTHAASSPPPVVVAAATKPVAMVATASTKKSGSFSSQIKNKIFGKKSSKSTTTKTESQVVERKSPSTTADSGRGSQGHLEDKLEAMTLSSGRHHHEELDLEEEEEEEEELEELEYDDEDDDEDDEEDDEDDDENDAPILSKKRAHLKKQRTNSCPDISSRVFNIATTSSKRCPMAGHEIETSDEDENNTFKCSGRTRLNPKYVQQHHQQIAISSRDDVDYRSSRAASTISRRSAQTEDLADFDDNISSIVLDQFLSTTHLTFGDDFDSDATFSLSGTVEHQLPSSSTTTTSHVQTDLTLLNVESEIADYLQHCRESTSGISDEGMNFIAKHFFEYQSFMNIPHKAVHLHKMPASQAGTDPSMGWAPKNMLKAGKHQPAPAARANRVHRDPRPNGTKYGRAGKHEHREWGDRHGELRDEKAVCHKDAWTKFLANDDQGPRTAFECEFEDRVLATEDETLQEKLCHVSPDDLQLNALYAAANKSISGATTSSSGGACCELLTILTYAPTVQFVTATVKKAKSLPFNNAPFARIMLFEGRRLVEQKQTTVNPSLLHKSSLDGSAASTSSNDGVTDAQFSESFLFHVPPTKLEKSHIVIEIYDHDTAGEVKKIGHCVIGRKVDGTGNAHWIQMVRQHGLPVCMWHRIARN